MTKIKILFGFTILMSILYFFGFIQNTVVFYQFVLIKDSINYGDPLLYTFSASIIHNVIILIGILISSKCLYQIIKHGYFTIASKKLLRLAGYIFISIGILSILFETFTEANNENVGIFIGHLSLNSMLVLFGFVILAIADMVQIGYQLKSENELTI